VCCVCVCVGGGSSIVPGFRPSVLGVCVRCLHVCERVSEREVPVPDLRPSVLGACLCVRMCVRKMGE